MKHKAVRRKRGRPVDGPAHAVEQGPAARRRLAVAVRGEMDVDARALAVQYPADFLDFLGRSQKTPAFARLGHQEGHVPAAFRREAHRRDIGRVQQKGGAAQTQPRHLIFHGKLLMARVPAARPSLLLPPFMLPHVPLTGPLGGHPCRAPAAVSPPALPLDL